MKSGLWRWAGLLALGLACLLARGAASVLPAPVQQNQERKNFVGYLHERELGWRPFEIKGSPNGLTAKLLSRDSTTGAVSLIVKYPAGWRQPARGYHSAAMEFFVRQGALKIGQRNYGERAYTYVPAGVVREPLVAVKETTVLQFFEAAPEFIPANESRVDAKRAELVEYKNYYDEPWISAVELGYSKIPGIFMKVLRYEPQTGAMTWIAGSIAGRPPRKYEVHQGVEECFCLEGEFSLAECLPAGIKVGPLTQGSYFYRPPKIRHVGPLSGSRSYVLWFFRVPEKLTSEYFDDCGQ